MRRDVAAWLESRLCPDLVRVDGALVAADALALLRAGVVGAEVRYDRGRLIGEVPRELLGAQRPLYELPVHALDPDDDPAISTFTVFGDLAGGRAQVERAVARATAADDRSGLTWATIAETCRFYTGDDERAMGYLERAPFPEVADDWTRIFGDAGAARVEREQARVRGALEQAFDGVAFPGPAHSSLFQAEAWDSGLHCDQARDHTGRWQELPREHLRACQWAIFRLDPHALRYYLPAILDHLVREPHGGVLGDHVRVHLERADRGRHHLFSPAQLAAVATFAAYAGMPAAVHERWQAMAGDRFAQEAAER